MVDDLKIAVAHEKMSIQDFCEQVLGPAIQQVAHQAWTRDEAGV